MDSKSQCQYVYIVRHLDTIANKRTLNMRHLQWAAVNIASARGEADEQFADYESPSDAEQSDRCAHTASLKQSSKI